MGSEPGRGLTLPAVANGQWHGARGAPARDWRDRKTDSGWDPTAICPDDPDGDASPGTRGWRELGHFKGELWRDQHDKRRRVVQSLRRAGYVARHRWDRRSRGTRIRGQAEVESFRYVDGPAAGQEAIDPWEVAAALGQCSAWWGAMPRWSQTRGLLASPAPMMCGRGHMCPVCANFRSRAVAGAIRGETDARGSEGLRFGTLTHRDVPGVPLADELDRLLDAWGRMTKGRTGDLFRLVFAGTWRGMEVTRGAPAGHPTMNRIKDGSTSLPGPGLWWHAHLHVLFDVRAPEARWLEAERRALAQERKAAAAWLIYRSGHGLDDGDTLGSFRWKQRAQRWEARARYWRKLGKQARAIGPEPDAWFGQLWKDSTARAARDAFPRHPGESFKAWSKRSRNGWDPHAGMQQIEPENPDDWHELPSGDWAEPKRSTAARRLAGDWSGPWWKHIEGDEAERRKRVYQAAKYPTPMCSLNPVPLAEFVAVAYMRRWHQGAGRFRGVIKRAKTLERLLVDTGSLGAQDPGVALASFCPGKCPGLDDLDARTGWEKPPTLAPANEPPADDGIRWKLAASAVERIPGLWAVLEQAGCFLAHDGDGAWYAEAPRGMLRAGLRDYLAGIKPPDGEDPRAGPAPGPAPGPD